MAYRTYVNDTQIFGNNEYYTEWVDFLKAQDIEIDEDDGIYEGEITDVMGMFEVIDKITKRLIKERHEQVINKETYFDEPIRELTDLSNSNFLDDETPVLLFNKYMIDNAYCFLPYQVFKAVEDIIEPFTPRYINDGVDWAFCTYKLKDGATIKVRAC